MKNQIPGKNRGGKTILFLIFSMIFFYAFPQRAETVLLKGGSKIEGKILKKNSGILVIDLGFDVLRIPAAQIQKISEGSSGGKKASSGSGMMYSESETDLVSTVEAVNKFAPSVLVVRTTRGLGSGFFINKQGYLVTNFHVIKEERHISVTQFLKSGNEMRRMVYEDVRIVAVDPFHDLAVLKVEEDISDRITPVVFAPDNEAELGETIFVIGNPLGLERTVTEGVISHIARNFAGRLFIQVDAPVNPGNSGGPLFNRKGQVIGVINMSVLTMEGLNFAIPIRNVKFLLENLEAYSFNENSSLSGYFYPAPPRRYGNGKKKDVKKSVLDKNDRNSHVRKDNPGEEK